MSGSRICGRCSSCGSPGAANAPSAACVPEPRMWTTSWITAEIGRCSPTARTSRACATVAIAAKLRRKFTGGAAKTAERLGAPAWLPLRTGACGDLYRPPPGSKMFETDDAKPRGLLRAGFFPHGLRAAGKNPTSWGKQEESSTISRRRISRPPGRSANRGCAPPYPSPCQTQGSGDAPAVCALQQISELPYRRTTFIVRSFSHTLT